MSNEIWVVPFFGQGHLLPSMELCKQIASRKFNTTLVIPSNLSSSIPSSLRQYPHVQIFEIPSAPPPPPQPGYHPPHHHNPINTAFENLLSSQPENQDPVPRPVCVVLDVMMGWTADVFKKFNIPTVAFFTSGACSAAMEYAMWKARPLDIKPGETRLLPGLPEEMAIRYSDIKQRPHGPPPPPPHGGGGPPPPGAYGPPPPDGHGPPPPGGHGPLPPGGHGPEKGGPPEHGDHPPPWVEEAKGSIAMMINTCDDLERPFIDYIANQKGVPVLGVGPLLPEQYWKSAGSILHDREFRTNRRSNVTEDEVIQWLDSKPRGSVLYIAFGTEVGPTTEEYEQLAGALEASTQPFIWVIQPGSGRPGPPPLPDQPGADKDREGYYPHGLESRVGDREDLSEKIQKDEIIKGIEKLMADQDVKRRAIELRAVFEHGFPSASMAALDAFRDLLYQIQKSV
ncbi:hypothetical protein FEM48_Zijuj11G0129700 [Ziziphus jujuba var. spinosa]|uniref:Uncharacterized protein n=1 Tax=Ziziphus jujuba var. spinosa TaxID=714518 RepID=A0A978UJ25_ZIZJJ|nr:hypothetical protein FEM48_Zijuj11G0129700 [Ziziphus jujuba var. spinosa]